MEVTLRILRYDSEPTASGGTAIDAIPAKPHWVEYKVSVDPMDRVLDLLIKVR
jgi:succinate dehydrogenase/fumarate reductase-like Fe-S protein